MNDSTPTITRYLLGELSEGERSALEDRYFADPRVFEELVAAETALVDDYVRGRLEADMRRRFEQAYLADVRRRNRVRFAAALAARVDQSGAPPSGQGLRPPLTPDLEPASGWPSWLGLWPPKPRLGFVVAAVLLASTGIWLAIQFGQSREDSSQVVAGRDGQEPLTPGADPAEQRRAPDVERPSPGPADQPPAPTRPSPRGLPTPSFATLILAVGGGERGQDGGNPPVLVIPPGTANVRLQLQLREPEHVRYQVVVRAIGGPEVLRRADLRPAAEVPGAVLMVLVPASLFSAGDYMLTLQGAAAGNELEDLSQSLFRVAR